MHNYFEKNVPKETIENFLYKFSSYYLRDDQLTLSQYCHITKITDTISRNSFYHDLGLQNIFL